MFDMFFRCNPGTKPGGHFQRNEKWHFCSPGTTAWIPAAQRIFHVPKPPINPTGKMVSGPPIEIASC